MMFWGCSSMRAADVGLRDAECRGSDTAGRRSATAEGRSRAGFLRYGTILLAMLFFLCCVCDAGGGCECRQFIGITK